MGYEIIMLLGKSTHSREEIERDMTKPYADGSGFEYKRDEAGSYVKTGRKETWFMVMATIDLCKVGYQDDALNKLISEAFEKGKLMRKEHVHYFYAPAGDGNNAIREDSHECTPWPVPVADVLAAMREAHPKGAYRRTDWAMALMEAMASDPEKLEVMFFGH